jgi:hypothetical protein
MKVGAVAVGGEIDRLVDEITPAASSSFWRLLRAGAVSR